MQSQLQGHGKRAKHVRRRSASEPHAELVEAWASGAGARGPCFDKLSMRTAVVALTDEVMPVVTWLDELPGAKPWPKLGHKGELQ